MTNLSNVIKISAADYATLAGGGTITKGGVTYSYDANSQYYLRSNNGKAQMDRKSDKQCTKIR